MKIFFLAFSLILLFAAGCKKEDSCNLTESTLVGTYKLNAATYRESPSSIDENWYATLNDCVKDNVYIFNADRTFYFQDVGMICIPPLNESSLWSLNGTSLTFAGEVNNVTSFNCNTLVTIVSNMFIQGDVLTTTYIRQ